MVLAKQRNRGPPAKTKKTSPPHINTKPTPLHTPSSNPNRQLASLLTTHPPLLSLANMKDSWSQKRTKWWSRLIKSWPLATTHHSNSTIHPNHHTYNKTMTSSISTLSRHPYTINPPPPPNTSCHVNTSLTHQPHVKQSPCKATPRPLWRSTFKYHQTSPRHC